MNPLPKPPTKRWYKRAWLWCVISLVVIIAADLAVQRVRQAMTPAIETNQQTVATQVRNLSKSISTTGKITSNYGGNTVDFLAAESEVFDLSVDQIVELTVPTYDNGATTYHGTVESVANHKTVGSVTDSGYSVQVQPSNLPEEVERLVDLTVNIKIVIESKDNVLSIERAAVRYDDNDTAYVLLTDETQRTVTTGFEGDDYVEIISGLDAGTEVLLNIPKAETASLF